MGVQPVGTGYWDGIHICLQSLHSLSNASIRNGEWQYGKQPTAIFSYII